MDGRLDGWFVIVSALLFVARAEDAARARARAHRSTAAHHERMRDLEKFQLKKELRRSVGPSERFTGDVISSHALSGQWAGRRSNTSHRSAAFGVSFLKCAQVDTGSGVAQVTLVVRNPEGGRDLSQLCIRDSVSGVTLMETSGSIQETGYQTFSADTLPAGSQYEVVYRMSVRGNREQVLTLPAYLTFSNATQNDIHLFGPVLANLTLRIHTTEQVAVERSLLFLVFMGSFLLSLLMMTLGAVSVKILQRRHLNTVSGVSEGAGPDEGMSDITASANKEAAFEDKFVDILMLEEPQNMIQALDSLQVSTLARAAVALECVRVQLFKALVALLLAGVGRLSERAEGRVLGAVQGQVLGLEGRLQEEQRARVEALAEQLNLETQQEMEEQRHTHMSDTAHAERLLQHAPQHQGVDVRSLLAELQDQERARLQNRLRVRHGQASARAHRGQALRRRCELISILGSELGEAERAGELDQRAAHTLLRRYCSWQDALEEGLDVLVANQRALLAERHAQRRFLVQSLLSLEEELREAFSRDTHRERSDVQLEILRVKQKLEETVCRERRAIRCDIIKRRRQLLSEKVCEHWRQLPAASGSDVGQFLQIWVERLMEQNNELSELINQLDEETAARARKVSVCVLAELRCVCPGAVEFLPQTQAVQERLQWRGQAAALQLRATRGRGRRQERQERRDQARLRDAFTQFCSGVCAGQRSLSREQRLRLRLECVKAACRLDRCLVLHHAECELQRLARDPAVTPEVQLQRSAEVTELRRFLQERLRPDHTPDHTPGGASVFQEEQLRVCEECVSVFVASLQWERAERKTRVTETHTALLELQKLITADTHTCDITHAIHTHRLALEEAELRLQQEEESAEGRGCSGSDDDDDDGDGDDEEDVFTVNADAGVSVLLQEALFKRQRLQRLIDRELRRNQTLEHRREQLQLKRLQTYCEQDVAFTAALVQQAQVSAPDLHRALRLLLPTGPEGELLSLTGALGPAAGDGPGSCPLSDRLRLQLLSSDLSHSRETDRWRKKRHKILDKLLSDDTRELPEPAEGAGPVGGAQRTDEGACPVGVAQRTDEGACPVGVAQRTDEGACPVGVAHTSGEGACPVGVAHTTGDRACPVGVAQRTDEGACPVGVAQRTNEGACPVGVAQDSLSSERLFVFRCSPPSAQLQTHTPRSRKRKRNFLNFKKASVAPQHT